MNHYSAKTRTRTIARGLILWVGLSMAWAKGCNNGEDADAGADTHDTGSGTDSDAGTGTDSDQAYTQMGACGRSGEAIASVESYAGTEEIFLIGPEPEFEQDICRIRYDVTSISEDAPAGCEKCEWTHTVQFTNVGIITDLGGNCERSELGVGPDEINSLEGATYSYGVMLEYLGHANTLMIYDEQGGEWEPFSMASWASDTGALSFNRLEGYCRYYF